MTPHARHTGLAQTGLARNTTALAQARPSQQPPWSHAAPPPVHHPAPSAEFPAARGNQDFAERARPIHAGTDSRFGLTYLVVLACVAFGMVLVWYSPRDVRWGAAFAGAALVVSSVARLVLPGRFAGMLACRQRYLDAGTLAVLGLGIAIVGLLLPPPT
jgi:hypothetical protein